jgi:hypothetical protein
MILLGKDEIGKIIFPVISVGLVFVIMVFIYLIYNPLHYIKIKRETPMENIFFYLYILSDNDRLDFLFENKINEHYEKCGVCKLCKRFTMYLKSNENNYIKIDDEKESLISDEKSKNNINIVVFIILSIPIFNKLILNKLRYIKLICIIFKYSYFCQNVISFLLSK